MNGAGVLADTTNQDQNGSRFLLMRPVIMRGELACGHRVSPHGLTWPTTVIPTALNILQAGCIAFPMAQPTVSEQSKK